MTYSTENEAEDALESLELWKAEAEEVLSGWDKVAALFEMWPEDLGKPKSTAVFHKVLDLQARVKYLERVWEVIEEPAE